MMRKSLLIVALLAGMLCPAIADIVYTNDGKKYEGTVRKEDDTVFIETADGPVELAADEVMYISSSTTTSTDDEGPDADPDEPVEPGGDHTIDPAMTEVAPPPPPSSADDFTGGVTPASRTFDMTKAARPESIVFVLMRQMAAAKAPRQARALGEQVERWQATAHDRQRRAKGEWVRPGDFVISRHHYQTLLAEAKTIAAELRLIKDNDEKADDKREALRIKLNTKLSQVAAAWVDDDIRLFLTGVAHYQTESYSKAATAFNRCLDSQPLVSAYQQAYGMTLMNIEGREIDALQACMNELSLHPDNGLALRRVRKAHSNVPGGLIKDDVCVAAEELLEQYEGVANPRAPKATVWHMPGTRGWSSPDGTLPTPPYDRLDFRQGIAIPVTGEALLIDKRVVANALEVYVLLDTGELIEAEVRQLGRRGAGVPLAVLRTKDVAFTPVSVSEDAQFAVGGAVITHGLGFYQEMGTAPREVTGTILTAPPILNEDEERDKDAEQIPLTIDIELVAGEGAAPVLTGDRRLVGFLAGRTNFRKDNGGVNELISVFKIAEAIGRPSGRSRRSSGREVEPIVTEAATFVVYCISGEKLE